MDELIAVDAPVAPADTSASPSPEAPIILHTWMAHVYDDLKLRKLIPALGGFEYREQRDGRDSDTPSNYAARFEAFLSEPLG